MNGTYDFIAVGLGPFNLGLACLAAPVEDLNGLVLEAKPEFDWHPGMLLEGTTLQTPFLADLVTLADPTSPYSFLNYLKAAGRIYSFYIRESFFPLRHEYVDYCRWAAAQLPSIRFGQTVARIEYDDDQRVYLVHADRTAGAERVTYRTRRLVLGTGTPPHLPDPCRSLDPPAVHSSHYLEHRSWLRAQSRIVLVGSGQSAAELYHDLLQDLDRYDYELVWITRSPRFFPLEYTKLTLELTSPEYTGYFHGLPPATRDQLVGEQASLYKGINSDLINAIFDLLYQKQVTGRCRPRTRLVTSTALTGAEWDADRKTYLLRFRQEQQGREFRLSAPALILATGYRYRTPRFLDPVLHRVNVDDQGRFAVRRNYSVDTNGAEIFVQNAELHTHGFVAPDLGMAAYRNSYLIREMLGREHYPIETSTMFQEFGVPALATEEGSGS